MDQVESTKPTNLDVPDNATMVLPPHGFIAVQAVNASDLDVVNAARVSFAKQSEWEYVENNWQEDEMGVFIPPSLHENDEKVLRYLLKNRHGTPFEHTYFKFHVRAPIFVFREWHRHRVGWSYNEESGRYTELQPDFYIPESNSVRKQTGKPGRYTFEPTNLAVAEYTQDAMKQAYSQSYSHYKILMEWGVAKELARSVLPVGLYSQMIATCNARSLMNFISLRNSDQAMLEIRKYAQALEDEFKKYMPITYDEFIKNGRQSP